MVITGRAVRVVGAIPADPAMENRFTVLRAWEGIHAALVHRERSSRNAASRLGVQRAGSWKRTSGLRGRSPGSARRLLEDVLEAFRERGALDFRACVYATVPPRSRARGHSKIVDSTGSESIEQGDTGQHQPLEGCI